MNRPPLRPDFGLDSGPDADAKHPHRSLSALADGDADAAPSACALWRDDAEARRYWHTVHLIGDVMRSDELAQPPGRDAALLAALRTRLAAEPVPFAPAPAPAPVVGAAAAAPLRQRLGWRAPAAAAAGFAVVAAVVVVTRGGPDAAGPQLAGNPTAGGVLPVAGGARSATVPAAPSVQIRDPRLDAQLEAYLRAHQAARGGAAVALPGGALRNAEMLVTPSAVPAPGAASLPAGGPR